MSQVATVSPAVPENLDEPEKALVLGVVADPGRATNVAKWLAGKLPGALAEHVDSRVTWEIRILSEPAPLDGNGEVPLVRHARKIMSREGWDIMVCLTDLPRFVQNSPIVASYSVPQGAVQVSLPGIDGWLRVKGNVEDVVVYALAQIRAGGGTADGDGAGADQRRPQRLKGSVRPGADREGDFGYLVLKGIRGKARMLSGMVYSNSPWRLVTGLARAVAVASAAAAFGIFFSNVWTLADALHPARLAAISVFTIGTMVAWLIIYNNLWERPAGKAGREQTLIYNTSTVLTLSVGVACMYAVLFAITLAGAAAVIPTDYLQSTLGHPVSWGDYVSLAWLASSMGTVAGALGSGLENEESIRRAAYSRREQERQTRHREAEEAEEAAETGAPAPSRQG